MPRCHQCGQESMVAAQHPGLCEECHPGISLDKETVTAAIEAVKQEDERLQQGDCDE